MKTMISVPEDILDRVTRRSRALRMSRSEFFTRAASRYLDELDDESTTQQINEALIELATHGAAADDPYAAEAVVASRQLLARPGDDW